MPYHVQPKARGWGDAAAPACIPLVGEVPLNGREARNITDWMLPKTGIRNEPLCQVKNASVGRVQKNNASTNISKNRPRNPGATANAPKRSRRAPS